MWELLLPFMPGLVGAGFWWVAGKCRGRNAKTAFQFAAWGCWLKYLTIFSMLFPFSFLAYFVLLAPSVICFMLAVSFVMKEMRTQQRGDFTDAA